MIQARDGLSLPPQSGYRTRPVEHPCTGSYCRLLRAIRILLSLSLLEILIPIRSSTFPVLSIVTPSRWNADLQRKGGPRRSM